jgi:hypothetical protein
MSQENTQDYDAEYGLSMFQLITIDAFLTDFLDRLISGKSIGSIYSLLTSTIHEQHERMRYAHALTNPMRVALQPWALEIARKQIEMITFCKKQLEIIGHRQKIIENTTCYKKLCENRCLTLLNNTVINQWCSDEVMQELNRQIEHSL